LRLAGGVTQGSGTVNEDGWGYVGPIENAGAAWVFDGVTGINGKNLLPGPQASFEFGDTGFILA
jgi:hypothetical protein